MIERFKALRQLPRYASMSWRLFLDPRVPFQLKVVLFVAVLAVFSPLDLLEWLPVPAPASTLVLMVLVLRTFVNAVPEELRVEHMEALGLSELA